MQEFRMPDSYYEPPEYPECPECEQEFNGEECDCGYTAPEPDPDEAYDHYRDQIAEEDAWMEEWAAAEDDQ